MKTDERFMKLALRQALSAQAQGDVPVGAVIVKDGAVLATGCNRRECQTDAAAHAELEAIRAACKALGDWRLTGCTLYVTLEPCVMCFGAIINARLDAVVFGAYDPQAGCVSCAKLDEAPLRPLPQMIGGYMEAPCKALLQSMFQERRDAVCLHDNTKPERL